VISADPGPGRTGPSWGWRTACGQVISRKRPFPRQLDALKTAGCRRVFADKRSGKTADRPELAACHAPLAAGDTLVVPSLDRYGRSLADLITMVGELRKREIGFTSLHENLDTTTPGDRLIGVGEVAAGGQSAGAVAVQRPLPIGQRRLVQPERMIFTPSESIIWVAGSGLAER
jgi:hypothetical protein